MDEKKPTLVAELMRHRDKSVSEICEAVGVSRHPLPLSASEREEATRTGQHFGTRAVTAEQESAADRKIPFPASEASEGFTRSLAESTQALVDQNRARFIPPENILRLRHGEGWNIRRTDASEDVGSFKEIEVLQSIGKDRILSNDLNALLEFVQSMVKELSERDERLMIETIARAAEQSGNEVSAPEAGSPVSKRPPCATAF